MVLLPILGLLAGAGIAVALLLALTDDDGPGSPAEAAETRQAGSIVLDAQDYVGRPLDDVTARLTGLGLRVQLQSEVRDDVVPDQVTGIEPEGEALESGDTVVVRYAVARAGDGGRRDGERGHRCRGGGRRRVRCHRRRRGRERRGRGR